MRVRVTGKINCASEEAIKEGRMRQRLLVYFEPDPKSKRRAQNFRELLGCVYR